MRMMPDSTDFAILLTPAGIAAIAVVRICGRGVGEFLGRHFSGVVNPNRPIHGILRDGNRDIDDVVIVLHEDSAVADINLHGGTWVVQACLDLAQRDGFRVIDPITLPLDSRAVDARSALESEMLTHLPLATTELALRVLLAQPAAWESLRARGKIQRAEIQSILNDRSLHWLLHPPRVAIVGAANVGKSTLANQLFAQERSITADVPGTTRDWVGEIANLDGLAVMLVDTPGHRATDDAIERNAIAYSAQQIEQADLVVLVLDATRALEPDQLPLLERHPDAVIVINKIDLPAAFDRAPPDAIRTIATTGRGVDELRHRIRCHFGCDRIEVNRRRAWTDRQRELLRRALDFPQILAEI